MIKYVIQKDSIAFFDGEQTQILSNDNTVLFSKVKEYLKQGNLEKVKTYSCYDSYVKAEFPELELVNNVYYFKELELTYLSNTVTNFVKQGLPLTPILKFVEKTNKIEDKELRKNLQKAVSEGNYPLTWEGDIVAYKRSSWNQNNLRAPEFANTEEYKAAYKEFKERMFDIFVPGQYVVTNNKDNLLVSSFDWVSHSCPDSGAFYDVKVFVKDIVSVTNNNILTKGYTNLEKLSETYVEDKNSVTGVLMQVWTGTNKYGEKVIIKQPLNYESIDLFIKDLNNGARVNSSYFPETVSVTSSC